MKHIWLVNIAHIFLINLCMSPEAHAAYHRFWIGVKKEELNVSEFTTGLQKVFFPKTIDAIKPFGLTAYQPVIISNETPNILLPDEIALVTYKDEKSHALFKESSVGQEYVNLHWDYFKRVESKSSVPEIYTGTIETDHSYDLYPSFEAWKKNSTTVIIYSYADLSEVKIRAETIKRSKKILGYIVLIKNGYVIEYISAKLPAKNLSLPKIKLLYTFDLPAVSKNAINPKTLGANFQF